MLLLKISPILAEKLEDWVQALAPLIKCASSIKEVSKRGQLIRYLDPPPFNRFDSSARVRVLTTRPERLTPDL